MSNVAARPNDTPLSETSVAADPVAQFQSWMQAAIDAGVPQPDAMTLATATADGRPSARVVLLKRCDSRGFVFFTNFQSRKGRELESNRYAALVFHWSQLERQVRVEGTVSRLSEDESDAYFRIRPRDSQISAIASPQSEVLASRDELERQFAEVDQQYAGIDVPRPPYWGGYLLAPTVVEFWQGRPGRLHDRLRYRWAHGWQIERLAP